MSTRLDFGAFSRALITTGDLDPVYIVLHKAGWNPEFMSRFLLAYGCYYHLGTAAYIADQDDYWKAFETAARNEVATPFGGRWPRSSERRHFRGNAAIEFTAGLRSAFPAPENFIPHLEAHAPFVKDVRAAVEALPGFGGWASFKFADLLDRVCGVPISIRRDEAMYDTPKEGARIVFVEEHGFTAPIEECIGHAERVFERATKGLMAPPTADRPLGFFELETCLCKYKSHSKGRYWVGKDILEIIHASQAFANTSPAANRLHVLANQLREGGW